MAPSGGRQDRASAEQARPSAHVPVSPFVAGLVADVESAAPAQPAQLHLPAVAPPSLAAYHSEGNAHLQANRRARVTSSPATVQGAGSGSRIAGGQQTPLAPTTTLTHSPAPQQQQQQQPNERRASQPLSLASAKASLTSGLFGTGGSFAIRGENPRFIDFRASALQAQLSQAPPAPAPRPQRGSAGPSRQRSMASRSSNSFAQRLPGAGKSGESNLSAGRPYVLPGTNTISSSGGSLREQTSSLTAPLLPQYSRGGVEEAAAAAVAVVEAEACLGGVDSDGDVAGSRPLGQQQLQLRSFKPGSGNAAQPEAAGVVKGVVVGCINVCVAIPAQIAFATIVFQNAMYAPFLGALCKFLFFSSAIHQITFMALSSLPCAVGQVQDIGLIFLSAIATSVADLTNGTHGLGVPMAMGTALVSLCLATLIVGLLTLLFGKLSLARLTQYVPDPVISGYLAYVGYFLFAGGIGLTTGVSLESVAGWLDVLQLQFVWKLAAVVITAVMLHKSVEYGMLPLVAVLLTVPALFHGVLLATGTTLQQAQDLDWVMKPMEGSGQFWDLWGFFNIDFSSGVAGAVHSIFWPAVFAQLPKVVGLFALVCFGSCLDVTAIQSASPVKMEFDQELVTVGTSNIITSLLGAGFSGSYIISQTKFTLGMGVRNRVSSMVIAGTELLVFALPFSVVQFLPKFFFAALLLWFGADFLVEQFWKKRTSLSRSEYTLLLLTFIAIMWMGLMAGIVMGIAMVTFVFAYEYAKSSSSSLNPVTAQPGSSTTVYSYSHMALLDLVLPRRVVAVSLNGFLFFGNSVSIADSIEECGKQLLCMANEGAATEEDEEDEVGAGGVTDTSVTYPGAGGARRPSKDAVSPFLATESNASRFLSKKDKSHQSLLLQRILNTSSNARSYSSSPRSMASLPSFMHRTFVRRGRQQRVDVTAHTLGRMRDAPLFLILDFWQVPRLDSTAAGRLANLKKMLNALGVQVLVSGLAGRRDSQVRELLSSNGLQLARHTPQDVDEEGGAEDEGEADAPALEFPSKEVASRYCEAQLLTYAASLSLVDPPQAVVRLPDLLAMHFSDPLAPSAGPVLANANAWGSDDLFPNIKLPALAAALEKYMRPVNITRGDILFEQGELLESLFLIESGKLHLYAASREQVEEARARVQGSTGHGAPAERGLSRSALGGCGQSRKADGAATALATTLEFGPGCFVCSQDFCLNQATAFTARCFTPTARLLKLHLDDYAALKREQPDAFIALQVALTRSISLELSSTLCQVLAA